MSQAQGEAFRGIFFYDRARVDCHSWQKHAIILVCLLNNHEEVYLEKTTYRLHRISNYDLYSTRVGSLGRRADQATSPGHRLYSHGI